MLLIVRRNKHNIRSYIRKRFFFFFIYARGRHVVVVVVAPSNPFVVYKTIFTRIKYDFGRLVTAAFFPSARKKKTRRGKHIVFRAILQEYFSTQILQILWREQRGRRGSPIPRLSISLIKKNTNYHPCKWARYTRTVCPLNRFFFFCYLHK